MPTSNPPHSLLPLGRTGLKVSRLSFGTVYFSSYGENLSTEAAASVLLAALERGVNTWDTSDDYKTHPHVACALRACALRRVPRDQMVVSSKISSFENSLDNVLKELGTDYLDILLAHCVELNKVEAWREVIRSWLPEKARGRVRAIGLSTHSAKVAALASEWPETDVILMPINAAGVTTPGAHFEDGGVEDMLRAAKTACANGKGVLAMKVMGGGTLAKDPAAAVRFVARLPYVHSLCIGMRNLQQVEENLRLLQENGI